MKIKVDQEKCLGCGVCYNSIAPDLFEADEQTGKSRVAKQPQTEEEVKAAKEAIKSCPVLAIKEEDEA
jgi:ferredoxin